MPIRTFDNSNGLILDTDAMDQGLCIGTLSAPSGGSAVKSFASMLGTRVLGLSSNGGSEATELQVTYPGGVPTVALAPMGGTPGYATLWAYGTRTIVPTSGVKATTPGGTVAMAPEAFGMHFAGRATFTGHAASWGDQTFGALGSSGFYFDSPTPPAVVVSLVPGRHVSVLGVSPHPSIGGRWVINVRCIASGGGWPAWPALIEPVVYCFTRRSAPATSSHFSIYDPADNTLAWDLCSPGLLYPVRLMELPMDAAMGMPGGMSLGICGAPRGYATSVIVDEFNDPPQWWQEYRSQAMWGLDGSNNLRPQLVLVEVPAPSGDPVSASGESPTSHAIVINVNPF